MCSFRPFTESRRRRIFYSVMNTNYPREPLWKTYIKATTFVLPALIALALTFLFVLPRLRQIWENTAFRDDSANEFVSIAAVWLPPLLILAIALLVFFVLLEEYSEFWRRNRGRLLRAAVYVLNSVAAILFICLLVYGVMAISRW